MRCVQSSAILCACLVVSTAQAARLTTAPQEPPAARAWPGCDSLRAIEAAVAGADRVVPEEFDGSVDDTVLCAGRGLFGRRTTSNRVITGRSGTPTTAGRQASSNPWRVNRWKVNRWTQPMTPGEMILLDDYFQWHFNEDGWAVWDW